MDTGCSLEDMPEVMDDRDELISDVLLWTPSHKLASVGRPIRTYLQQLCTDTGCSLEDLPEVIDQSGTRSNGNERVLQIPQSFRSGVSPSPSV